MKLICFMRSHLRKQRKRVVRRGATTFHRVSLTGSVGSYKDSRSKCRGSATLNTDGCRISRGCARSRASIYRGSVGSYRDSRRISRDYAGDPRRVSLKYPDRVRIVVSQPTIEDNQDVRQCSETGGCCRWMRVMRPAKKKDRHHSFRRPFRNLTGRYALQEGGSGHAEFYTSSPYRGPSPGDSRHPLRAQSSLPPHSDSSDEPITFVSEVPAFPLRLPGDNFKGRSSSLKRIRKRAFQILSGDSNKTSPEPFNIASSQPEILHEEYFDESGLASQQAAISLPSHIDCLSDIEQEEEPKPKIEPVIQTPEKENKEHTKYDKRRNGGKLRRNHAYYKRNNTDVGTGRSKSLTHIDALDGMLVKDGMDGEPAREKSSLTAEDKRNRLMSPSYMRCTSSEFITVTFEFGDESPDELVPVGRGLTLREILSPGCEKRNMDINHVVVYSDFSRNPMPLHLSDTYKLGGKHIRVKPKEEKSSKKLAGQQGHSAAKRSGSGFSKTGRTFNISAEDCGLNMGGVESPGSGSQEGSLKVAKSSKQTNRWSGIFGTSYKDKERYEQLVEQLNIYNKRGIPPMPDMLTYSDDASVMELLRLEADWKDIVLEPECLSDRERQQQNATWELIQSELQYMQKIRVVTDLFLSCLHNLQASHLLTEIDKNRLFSNITDIHKSNYIFWRQNFWPMLETARESGNPIDPSLLKDGFYSFEEVFYPYTRYCMDHTSCQQYCKERHLDNELFKTYLVWCETHKDCNRLRLLDLLVKPMQRLTKYSLLLKAILKHTDDTDTRQALLYMISQVDSFVYKVNSTLRHQHEQDRLREIGNRIDSYDVLETKDEELEKLVKKHCSLDLECSMPGCDATHRRYLMHEGDLKYRDQHTSKVDVHCFLFTDMLLITKASKKGEGRVKVIRQPLIVDRLVIRELARDTLAVIYLNEYRTVTAAFTLHGSDQKSIRTWYDRLLQAKEEYKEARTATLVAGTDFLINFEEPDDLEFPSNNWISYRSPRGSGRGSRVPSLIHSHSGSAEESPSPRAGGTVDDQADISPIKGDTGRMSPRLERKCALGKTMSGSPNTLTVQIPGGLRGFESTTPSENTWNFVPQQRDVDVGSVVQPAKRIPRIENRRYHTAGAIEDIKKQDNKDNSIHKRFSLNYGPGSSQCPTAPNPPSKCLSNDSMQSSSGVSSTGSMPFGSECDVAEEEHALSDCTVVGESGACSEAYNPHVMKPHVSTTYISQETPQSVYETQDNVRIDVSSIEDGVSSVQITVTDGGSMKSSKADLLRMKDIILNDASVEASEV